MTTASPPVSQNRAALPRLARGNLRAALNKRIMGWLAIGMFVFLYLPILILVIYSFNDNKVVGVWTGFSWQWYEKLWTDAAVISALRVSLWVAIWSTIISTVLGTLAALALERFQYRGELTFDAVLYLPIIIPDIVMALSTLMTWSSG